MKPLWYPRLLADVGGTNARFGWQREGGASIERVRTFPCDAYPDIESAIGAYLDEGGLGRPVCAAIAIATAVTDDRVCMTNHSWSFSIREVRERLGLQHLCVLNDFTALALGVPTLDSDAVMRVGGGTDACRGPIGVMGPGTGLGVSGLLPLGQEGAYLPIAGEGGHATLAAESEVEFMVLSALRERYGHVSAERVLSGQGLVDLHNVLARLACSDVRVRVPGELVERWHAGGDGLAEQCVSMFCAFLGSVAGNLALILGARGGVYVGGGIVPRLGERFAGTPFRARFEAKGRFGGYLASIPTWVVVASTSPALAGAGRALDLGGPTVGRWSSIGEEPA